MNTGLSVCYAIVDFAAARIRRYTLCHQRGQRLVEYGDQLGHQQPRGHAAIAVGEVAEVMVGAHFAAIDGVFSAHAFLDEGVPGFALDRHAACALDDIDSVPGQAWVMDDFFAGVLG